jgi:hypothetical protein
MRGASRQQVHRRGRLDCKLAIRACELVDRDVLTDTVASTGMHFIGLAAPGKSRVIPLAFLITAFLGGVFWAPIKAGLTLMYLERVANRRKEAAPDAGAKPAGEVA